MSDYWFLDAQIDAMLAVHCETGSDVGCLKMGILAGNYKNVDIVADHCSMDKLPIEGQGNTRSFNIAKLGCQCEGPPPMPGEGLLLGGWNEMVLVYINETSVIMPQPTDAGGPLIRDINKLTAAAPDSILYKFHCHPKAD